MYKRLNQGIRLDLRYFEDNYYSRALSKSPNQLNYKLMATQRQISYTKRKNQKAYKTVSSSNVFEGGLTTNRKCTRNESITQSLKNNQLNDFSESLSKLYTYQDTIQNLRNSDNYQNQILKVKHLQIKNPKELLEYNQYLVDSEKVKDSIDQNLVMQLMSRYSSKSIVTTPLSVSRMKNQSKEIIKNRQRQSNLKKQELFRIKPANKYNSKTGRMYNQQELSGKNFSQNIRAQQLKEDPLIIKNKLAQLSKDFHAIHSSREITKSLQSVY